MNSKCIIFVFITVIYCSVTNSLPTNITKHDEVTNATTLPVAGNPELQPSAEEKISIPTTTTVAPVKNTEKNPLITNNTASLPNNTTNSIPISTNPTSLPNNTTNTTPIPSNTTSMTTKAKVNNTTTTTTTTTAITPNSNKVVTDNVTSTTPMPSTTKSTLVDDHPTQQPATSFHQFHGPSFIGGIVLTVSVTAISFLVFKFYKAGKFDRDYYKTL